MGWTDKRKTQALNVLKSTDNDVELAARTLRRMWKKAVSDKELETLLSPHIVTLSAEAAWKNYTPTQGPDKTSATVISTHDVGRNIIIPDSHHPYVNKKAWATTLGILKDWEPQTGVIIGDFGDLNSVS